MGIGSVGGSYFNFILGTGSDDVGKVIKHQLKNRKANGQNYVKALYTGTKKGIGFSHGMQKKSGGFLKSLGKGFKAIPDGWEAGSGFGKLTGALKGCGKAMPALMAGLTVLGEIPNVYKAVKEKGVVQGLKEVGKTATRLTMGALCGAIGSAIIPIPFVGSMVGWFVGDWIGSKIVGKSYSEQAENKPKEKQNEQIPTNVNTASPEGIVAGGSAEFPSIDADDFGPYKPYANVFYNNPIAHQDIGIRMPGQSPMYGMYGMYPAMGVGISNNQSPNLLTPSPNGNLLTPTGPQNAYAQQPMYQQGTNLDLTK